MPRPTAARILYLLIGLLLGVILVVAVQVWVIPGVIAALPFRATPPPPPAAAGPSQFTAAQLDRVLAVNAAQQQEGATLRLNSLELYADGFSFTYALTNAQTGASPRTLEPETFSVTDDLGTAYTLSPFGTAAAASAGFTTGLASFTPAPPAEAQTLRVVVPNALAVGLRAPEGRVVAGPWEFQIALR